MHTLTMEKTIASSTTLTDWETQAAFSSQNVSAGKERNAIEGKEAVVKNK